MGAELRRPLGIAMVGGLIFSQLLTIFTTPVIYLYFDRWAARWRQAEAAAPTVRETPSADGREVGRQMNIIAPFVHRPVATTLLTHRRGARGRGALLPAAGVAAAAGGFPDRVGVAPRCRARAPR